MTADTMLRPAVAKLANAIVSVLGPEFRIGGIYYQKCKVLMAAEFSSGFENMDERVLLGRSALQDAWLEEEQVLFVQQLILYSPRSSPALKHISLLLVSTGHLEASAILSSYELLYLLL